MYKNITLPSVFGSHILAALLLLLMLPTALCAQTEAEGTGNDSTAFVQPEDLTTSLFICQPGLDFYSTYGHCSIRLQCPSEDLDFTFSYCLEDNLRNRIAMFQAKGIGQYAAFPTETFLREYRESKRGVEEYVVNLTTEQTRKLWQILDEEIMAGRHRQYNFLHTNCSSMCFYAIDRALEGDEMVFADLDPGVTGTYRNFVQRISEGKPWTGFFWTTIMGKECDENGALFDKMAPMLIDKSFANGKLRSPNGSERPFLVSGPTTIVEQGITYPKTLFTPNVCFIVLLVIALVVTLLERRRIRRPAQVFDIVLLTVQTIAGLAVFYLSCVSKMPGAAGNLTLLVLNPLPAVLWLLFRRRKWYGRVFWIYAAALLLYVALWPFSPMVDLTRVLMVSPLMVRVAARLI